MNVHGVSPDGANGSPPSLWIVLAMPASLALTVLALAFGLLVAFGLEEGDEAAPPATTQPPTNEQGVALFASQGCGGCHVLTAAGSQGTAGPSLDETKLSEAEIAAIVRDGRGAMPAYADRLSADEIEALAAYVSASAAPSP